jgi:guanine nucleotide exchange factor VAV
VPVTKRDFCAQELLETEKNYVDALNMVYKNFFIPLRGFITKEDREKIFINIEELKNLHSVFYEDLLQYCPDEISLCFQKHKDKFLKYGTYCSLLTKAQDHIQAITGEAKCVLIFML